MSFVSYAEEIVTKTLINKETENPFLVVIERAITDYEKTKKIVYDRNLNNIFFTNENDYKDFVAKMEKNSKEYYDFLTIMESEVEFTGNKRKLIINQLDRTIITIYIVNNKDTSDYLIDTSLLEYEITPSSKIIFDKLIGNKLNLDYLKEADVDGGKKINLNIYMFYKNLLENNEKKNITTIYRQWDMITFEDDYNFDKFIKKNKIPRVSPEDNIFFIRKKEQISKVLLSRKNYKYFRKQYVNCSVEYYIISFDNIDRYFIVYPRYIECYSVDDYIFANFTYYIFSKILLNGFTEQLKNDIVSDYDNLISINKEFDKLLL